MSWRSYAESLQLAETSAGRFRLWQKQTEVDCDRFTRVTIGP